jgi:DNA polymerase sigma
MYWPNKFTVHLKPICSYEERYLLLMYVQKRKIRFEKLHLLRHKFIKRNEDAIKVFIVEFTQQEIILITPTYQAAQSVMF